FAPHQGPQLVVLRAHRRSGLDPRGLLLDRDLRIARLDAQQLAPFGSDAHATTSFSSSGWIDARFTLRTKSRSGRDFPARSHIVMRASTHQATTVRARIGARTRPSCSSNTSAHSRTLTCRPISALMEVTPAS